MAFRRRLYNPRSQVLMAAQARLWSNASRVCGKSGVAKAAPFIVVFVGE